MNSYENEFIKFDTVKIRTHINNLISKNIEFNKNYNNGLLIGEYYNSKKNKSIPYNIYIGISYTSQSLTLEFSSKILLDDYPKLITQITFRQCLENLNKLGICTLDIDAICEDCYFAKVHITRDLEYELTDKALDNLNSCVGNYRRYKWKRYRKEGIRYSKDVKSKDCTESIVIYDKEQELETNKNFLSLLDEPDKVINYFQGKSRFEMELGTPAKICKALNIDTTHIFNVFGSSENPLLSQYNKIFGEGDVLNTSYIKNSESYEMMKNLQSCNGDLKKIEQELKDYKIYASRNGLTDKMKKYKQLHTQMYNNAHNSIGVLSQIREKLKK